MQLTNCKWAFRVERRNSPSLARAEMSAMIFIEKSTTSRTVFYEVSSFSVAGHTASNCFPNNEKIAASLETFKLRLMTYLFKVSNDKDLPVAVLTI